MAESRRQFLVLMGWVFALSLAAASCGQTVGRESSLPTQNSTNTLTVSAAASVTDALQAIKPLYQQTHDVNLTYNFGSSGSLQRQIEQGAPVDIFISAAPRQMDALQRQNLLVAETRKNLLTNEVVLIAPRNADQVQDFQSLLAPTVTRVAIADPASVPAGAYSQEVLTKLKFWEPVKAKLVLAKDVRQVLAYVATGNVDAGMVYLTDAKVSDQVRVVKIAPPASHAPVVYPVAVLKDSKNIPAAKSFVEFLLSPQAKAAFEKYGFAIAPQ